MPSVTFNFNVRGAEEVRRALRSTAQEAARITGRSPQSAAQEQAATSAALRSAAAKKKAAVDAAREVQKIEQQTTAVVNAEAGKRTAAEQNSYKQRVKSALAHARDVERAEQALTRAQEREQRKRERTAEQNRRALSNRAAGVGSALANGAVSAASNAYGQIQDARRTRAQTERELGVALYQTGANRAEVRSRMARLTEFSRSNGIDAQELASAASAAQTQFSTLTGDNEAQRSERFENFLRTALFARNTGNNIGETARLQGLLATTGLDANTQQSLLRFSAGASQAGAVEMGDVIRSGLQGITSRIASAQSRLGPNATQEERSAAAISEYRQAFSELQVEAAMGLGPRQGGNALAAVNNALQSSARQDRLLNNIRNARDLSSVQRRSLENALFVRGPGGRSRLRSTNSLDFVSAFARTVGADATQFANVFAGSGAGNREGLQANWRTSLGNLLKTDTTGRSGIERVNALRNVTLSEADVQRGADIFSNDSLSQLTRNEEQRLTALTENTGAIGRLTDSIASFAAQNPLLSAVGGSVAGAAAGQFGGLAARAGAGVFGAVAPGAAATLGGGVVAGGGAAIAATVAGGLALGGLAGEGINRAIAPRNADGSRRDNESVFTVETWRNFAAAVREAFAANPPVVQISPQAAAHATGVAASGSNSLAPEARANQ